VRTRCPWSGWRCCWSGTSTFRNVINAPIRGWQLRAIDLSTGQIRLVHSCPGHEIFGALTLDPTGRYLLAEYLPPSLPGGTLVVRLDVATGKVTALNSAWAVNTALTW
jgi:hypothetical protein